MSDIRRFWPAWLGDDLRAEIEEAYADPSRGYHDLTHLSEVLMHVDELMPFHDPHDPEREAVLLAAWFHDVVYDGQGDLEERSARRAETALGGSPLGAEVARLVRLTGSHRPEEHDRAGQVLCDADLAILAADPDRYASYARGVRKEYASVPDADFAVGRAAVLGGLLAKPSLFHTEQGRRRWEQRARANVEAEIRELRTTLDAPVGAEAPGHGAALVGNAYDALIRLLHQVDEHTSWAPTGCTGWAVRDLTFHCLADAQRAMVALHTPTDEAADRDAVSYWQDWAPDADGAARSRRHTRVGASMFLVWDQLRELYVETATAVVHAARAADPTATVRTQGHVLRVDDLLRTLCVEASLHHLDLMAHLDGAPGPTTTGLAEVRRTLDGLLHARGSTVDVGWSDERYALVATGRAHPTEDEARALGPTVTRFPVFS